jgi:hypothetical protein
MAPQDTRHVGSHHAIAATSNAIKLLLENAAPTSEWVGTAFELYQAQDLQKPVDPARSKVSIYLYRVLLSTVRRDRGARLGPDGLRYPASIPLDLHYLVTAWSSDARTSHQLLGWAIRVLDDTPVLPTALLNTYQAGRAVFARDETVELVWDPLTLVDLYDIWQVSAQNQAPSASYVARMVQLDSEIPIDEGDPVKVRQFEYAKEPA